MRWRDWTLVIAVGAALCAAALAEKGEKKSSAEAIETEREVTEAEVPAAALATLRKLAAGAEITEYAEESEEGHVFYEASWETASGAKVDVLVARTGALVEIEESVDSSQVPAAVRELARKSAGRSVPLVFEKKTTILYEVKFEDDDGLHELLLTPDGRCIEEEVEKHSTNDNEDEERDD
jgi:hypothetical protein